MEMLRNISSRIRAVMVGAALIFAHGAFAEDTRLPVGKEVHSVAKTSLLKLDPRQTATVSVAALERPGVRLVALINLIDEKGFKVATQKGVLTKRSPVILKLAHDKLDRYDAALLRAEVTITGRGDEPVAFRCPVGVGFDDGDDFVLTAALEPCQCGVTSGSHVFLACETPSGGLTTGSE